MPRADLLALTSDDLATMSNRGTVKRAQRELESCEATCELSEGANGDLTFVWSDGITCHFLAGKTVHDAICSSGHLGISRHIIRSVLYYQQQQTNAAVATQAASPTADSGTTESAATSPTPSEVPVPASVPSTSHTSSSPNAIWDPGEISDELLTEQFRKTSITQARKRFEQGVLVELTRGAKPVARFLDEGISVRFLVPGDPRYISADCADSLLPIWVPVAVWAFREFPADRISGLLALQQKELPVPTTAIESLNKLLEELCTDGIALAPASWSQRLLRLETSLRDEGLVWPAELVLELLHQFEMYQQHNARFDPRLLVQLIGELRIRTRAISRGITTVPQLLIRGSRSDRATEVAGGRWIGVGVGVRPGKRHTTISAYLQDVDSGTVAAVERTFADPDPKSGDHPKSFADLGGTVLVRGVSLADLGASQLLLKSGKRTPSGQLILPRTSSSLTTHPQSFEWEQLKPPFAAENFAQLQARFEFLPPTSLRPRRRTENLHVVAVAGIDQVDFLSDQQRLIAGVLDTDGQYAELSHPYHSRGQQAFEELVQTLRNRGDQVRYLCGHIRSTGRTLRIQPVSLIVEDGSNRIAVLPWMPRAASTTSSKSDGTKEAANEDSIAPPPLEDFLDRLEDALADGLITGIHSVRETRWSELVDLAKQLGFVRLVNRTQTLAESLSSKSQTLNWDPKTAIRQILELCLLSRLAME